TYLGQGQPNEEIAKTLILKSIDKIEQLIPISLSDRVSFQYTVLLNSSTTMVAAILAGAAVAAAAYAGKYGLEAWQAFKLRPVRPRMRKFYEGGFQATMNRREAALILGVRESVAAEKVKEAHRRVMVANHPDAGGSHYLASKINEAKDMMLGKTKNSGSAF
ncbi:Chaperone J-domain superfamily, partial [Arabidopsis thaliana x Arabidopsis arenosa]